MTTQGWRMVEQKKTLLFSRWGALAVGGKLADWELFFGGFGGFFAV